MYKITKIFITCFLISISAAANSEPAMNLTGNYMFQNENEQLVLSFKDKGVVLLRRYKSTSHKSANGYKSIPSESIWAPYIEYGKNTARALVCENGNPFGKCDATSFSADGNNVDWGDKTFQKTSLSFNSSKFDFGPYTFEKLSEIYKFKFSKIVQSKL